MHAAGGGMGQGVGDAAAVADDVQPGQGRFQVLADGNLHVVELDFHTVQKGIIVGGAGGNLIQRVDHFDDAVQNALGQHQAQIAGGGVQGGGDEEIGRASCRERV